MSTHQVRWAVYGALLAALALVLAAPTPAASLQTLRDAGSADVVSAPLVALLALLAWCLAAYLLVVAALTAGSHLPGVAGRALGVLACRSAPVGLRRALEVALGVSLAVATLGAGTASASGALPLPGLTAHSASAVASAHPAPVVAPDPLGTPSLDHPVTSAPTPPLDHPVTSAPTPSLDHPVASAPAAPSPAPDLDWPTGRAPAAPAPAATPPPAEAPNAVVVQPGDSLWSIAEERLEQQTGEQAGDAQVAAAWPGWWQANREAVGDDPDLLHPGTPLVPPPDS